MTNEIQSKISEISARAQARAEKEAVEAITVHKITGALPDLPCAPRYVHGHGYPSACVGSVCFEVSEWGDAWGIKAILGAVPISRVKDSCLAFVPTDCVDASKRADIADAGDMTIRVDQTPGYPERATVKWWALLGSMLIQVTCEIKNHGFRIAVTARTGKTARSRATEWELVFPESWGRWNQDRFWSPSGSPPSYTLTERS